MIDRISIVSRLAQTLYADGVPADRVKYIPHHMALLDVVAESFATGKAPSVPLSLMAGDPCPYEPVGGSELDQPIPFMVVEPSPAPSPETSPEGAAAVVEPVKIVAETQRSKPGPKSRIDWDAETRLGKMGDAELAKVLGVTPNSVRMARVARGIAYEPDRTGNRQGPKSIDWDNEPRLGKMTDKALAEILGVNPSAVHQARAKRGIPAHVPRPGTGARPPSAPAGIDWNAETRLGQVRDSELARELGVSPGAVHQARQARGIPSASPKPKAPPPPTVTPERQAELDKIEAAVQAGKVKRITPEEAKANLEAKYRAERAQYGWKPRAAKKGKAVAS